MSAYDLDPNYGLPLWQALVRYFRAYPPIAQAPQQLELPLRKATRKSRRAVEQQAYLPRAVERRLPVQPSP